MLGLFFLPGLGLVAYVLFGRDRKAFAEQRTLLRQDLEGNSRPYPRTHHDPPRGGKIARLQDESAGHRKLMMLVWRHVRCATPPQRTPSRRRRAGIATRPNWLDRRRP